MFILILIPNGDTDNTSYSFQSNDCYETQDVSIYERITTRSWRDYFSSGYCVEYTSQLDEYVDAKNEREQFEGYNDGVDYKFWGRLYAELYDQNKDKLDHITDSLWRIKEQKELNRFDFANMITCFVQDIPYVYVLPNGITCEDMDDPSSDCLENVKYGILSPIEFLHTLKGDCDTRTVLLYTLTVQLLS